MAIETLTSEPTDWSEKSLDIHANPTTWVMLALLLDKLGILGFSFGSSYTYSRDTTSSWAEPQFEEGIRYFFETGIHQIPEEIRKDRDLIAGNLDHWIAKFQLKPIEIADLEAVTHASSGTYFLSEGDTPRHVVKPVDEDILCINNPIFPGLPGAHLRVRENIPLYHSAERECAAFQVSHQLGLAIVPTTSLAAIESSDFHDISKPFTSGKLDGALHLFNMEKKVAELLQQSGTPSFLKLCSLRDYVPHSTTLSDFLNREDHSIDDIDPRDIVAANLLMWVSGNTDGHPGNILVYPKGVKEDGTPLFGLQVIDLCLAFPEKNGHLLNTLPDIFTTSMVLPQWATQWIQEFSMETASQILDQYELTGCQEAMVDRIEALKLFAGQNLTLEEIDTRLKYLGSQRSAALDVGQPFTLPRYNDSFASTWTNSDTTTIQSTWLRA